MSYTERVDGIQIRDVIYLGKPPEDAPPRFDVVKWVQTEPFKAININTGEWEMHTEYCYTIARLEWDRREGEFNLISYGLRWLKEKLSDAVIEMVLRFCEEKWKELECD